MARGADTMQPYFSLLLERLCATYEEVDLSKHMDDQDQDSDKALDEFLVLKLIKSASSAKLCTSAP